MIEDKQEGDEDSNQADDPTDDNKHTDDPNPGSKLPLSYHLIIKYKQLQVQLILLLSFITYRSISTAFTLAFTLIVISEQFIAALFSIGFGTRFAASTLQGCCRWPTQSGTFD